MRLGRWFSLFDFVPSLVTVGDDVNLCRKPDMDEVRQVVFSINLDSASGPDGFCSKFYQYYWDIISNDLLEVVLDFLKGSAMPKGFQSTLLTHFPKKSSPTSWINFRPIILCNVNNKVLTKLLALRFPPLLPRLISPSTQ